MSLSDIVTYTSMGECGVVWSFYALASQYGRRHDLSMCKYVWSKLLCLNEPWWNFFRIAQEQQGLFKFFFIVLGLSPNVCAFQRAHPFEIFVSNKFDDWLTCMMQKKVY